MSSSAGTGLKPTLQPPPRADVGLVPVPQADERKVKTEGRSTGLYGYFLLSRPVKETSER